MASDRAILVVDDDFDIRESITALLEDTGYRVEWAANGREAYEYLRHEATPA